MTPPAISDEFLLAVPRTDLHVHLDESIQLQTLIELARASHVELPSYAEAGLRELGSKDQYADLSEYLRGVSYHVAVLQAEEPLERAAYELGQPHRVEHDRHTGAAPGAGLRPGLPAM